MDFEWSNSNGPIDPNSPFVNIPHQQSAKKRERPEPSYGNLSKLPIHGS
jgi:hypothetical protein